MFGLPTAKRVRREELHSPATSPRSSPDPELLRQRHAEYIFEETHPEDEELPDATNDEEGIELRLFATPQSSILHTQKIRISSPDVASQEPGFAVKRPKSYYFAEDVTSDKKAALQAVAVDGQDILEMSKIPWPGCKLPWKVTKISPLGLLKAVLVGHLKKAIEVEEKPSKRKRKGKKSRIATRKKLQASATRKQEQDRLAKEKEEAEKEKRTRRNREKKIKKKAREKAKKIAEGTAEDGIEAKAGPEYGTEP
ncbi:hypothetical protein P154DRAFT_544451 [Amniculicola lignicola CBS 123094]|uniref:Uncharacterized protein n=1 Tax=Amniculicola lignicola CBS 123094 TaxID=1392246 RepID=A0A6A5WNI5_9PLEO|nr:hypothetical protein P154DRAFT_544451 [Amniculicola lignicola CBS 123094]